MQDLLGHSAVQAGVAPLAAGMAAALVLHRLRLSGLAAAAGFFTAVYLSGGLDFEKRLLIVAAAAPLLGAAVDVALRPGRAADAALGLAFGIGAFWILLAALGQRPPRPLLLYALGVAALVGVTVVFSLLSREQSLRAAAAGVGLGAAVAISALFGGATLFGLWSFGLAAGCAGFMLVALMLGKPVTGGVSLSLSIGGIGAVMAAAVILQRWLPWYYAALFALIPLAARLPAPRSRAGEALAALTYALGTAAGICALIA